MSSGSFVTRWLQQLQVGLAAAAQQLWERYFPRLVGPARRELEDALRRLADEEDLALSAFDSFFRNVRLGRIPQLFDRDSFWHLLVVITARKAAEGRQKRGWGARRRPAPRRWRTSNSS